MIIEFSTSLEFFNIYGEAGWQTSFYLLTGTIVNRLQVNNISQLTVLAQKIARQVKLQKVDAISFDRRVYPFVKDFLEYEIPEVVSYHAWYAPAF